MKKNEFVEIASKKRKGLNRELLRKVAARLRGLRHEAHYDQGTYASKTDCGTACCIAGWVCIESGASAKAVLEIDGDASHFETPIADYAMRLLGLSESKAETLFTGDPEIYWPDEFSDRWKAVMEDESDERRSRIAADLLDAIADGSVKL